jgi:hypothetical protein
MGAQKARRVASINPHGGERDVVLASAVGELTSATAKLASQFLVFRRETNFDSMGPAPQFDVEIRLAPNRQAHPDSPAAVTIFGDHDFLNDAVEHRVEFPSHRWLRLLGDDRFTPGQRPSDLQHRNHLGPLLLERLFGNGRRPDPGVAVRLSRNVSQPLGRGLGEPEP